MSWRTSTNNTATLSSDTLKLLKLQKVVWISVLNLIKRIEVFECSDQLFDVLISMHMSKLFILLAWWLKQFYMIKTCNIGNLTQMLI